jgi:L-threonylcarbamoyladenylate synthase
MRVSLEEAAKRLNAGEVVAVPTETVYGLAARLHDACAVARLFSLKGRPQDNPLIAHVADERQARLLVSRVPDAFAEAKRFWPGPVTLVLPADLSAVPAAVRAGLATVAIRVPSHPLVRELIAKTGPLVAPSANVSGRPSATSPEHVEADFGAGFPVLDGGNCLGGVESTIVALYDSGWEVLRTGAVAAEDLAKAIGSQPSLSTTTDRPRSPGQKYRHYAPETELKLFDRKEDLDRAVAQAEPGYAVLGFGDSPSGALPLVSLGARGDFAENLRQLYAALRSLDGRGLKGAFVDADFERAGLGVTLYDRLAKAAKGS